MPEFNTELANAVLEQIDAHPDTWKQNQWANACGTAGCFAGWAVRLSGWEWADAEKGDTMRRYAVHPERRDTVVQIDTLACDLLGLSTDQANDLFFPLNDREGLGRIVAEITDGTWEE